MYGVSLAQVNFASELNASTSLCDCSIGRSVPPTIIACFIRTATHTLA